jgi:hypothetical protein
VFAHVDAGSCISQFRRLNPYFHSNGFHWFAVVGFQAAALWSCACSGRADTASSKRQKHAGELISNGYLVQGAADGPGHADSKIALNVHGVADDFIL